MPGLSFGYVPGSGFMPLFSGGNPYSGRNEPIGGIQLRAWTSNSGSIYISLSGGNPFSGQLGLLVGSGGPTINSGGPGNLSLTDGFEMGPGTFFLVPRLGIPNTGFNSGTLNICAGCDAACSGQAKLYLEVY